MHSVFIEHVERLRRLVVAMGLNAEEGQDILHDVYVEAVKPIAQNCSTASVLPPLRKLYFNRKSMTNGSARVNLKLTDAFLSVLVGLPHLVGKFYAKHKRAPMEG